MSELVDVAAKAFVGRRSPAGPDDGLLYALLSHQVIATRRSMLDFAREIFADLPDATRPQVLKALELLMSTYRKRRAPDSYTGYQPVSADQVHQLACYSANLVALRCVLEEDPSGVSLTQLLGAPDDALARWRSTPSLWKSGLDVDGLQAMLTTVGINGEPPRLRVNIDRDLPLMPLEISLARLVRDYTTETHLRYGAPIFAAIVGENPEPLIRQSLEGTSDDEIARIESLISILLRAEEKAPYQEDLLKLLFSLRQLLSTRQPSRGGCRSVAVDCSNGAHPWAKGNLNTHIAKGTNITL